MIHLQKSRSCVCVVGPRKCRTIFTVRLNWVFLIFGVAFWSCVFLSCFLVEFQMCCVILSCQFIYISIFVYPRTFCLFFLWLSTDFGSKTGTENIQKISFHMFISRTEVKLELYLVAFVQYISIKQINGAPFHFQNYRPPIYIRGSSN